MAQWDNQKLVMHMHMAWCIFHGTVVVVGSTEGSYCFSFVFIKNLKR